MQVSKLSIDGSGRVHGTCPNGQPIQHNSPWPCQNGSGGGMSVPSGVTGMLVHTQVGNNPGSIGWFNDSRSQASAHFCIAQDGTIVQMGPVNGWKAWHCAEGNPHWYGCEFADNGQPANALTQAQIAAGAQLLELLSRPGVGNFPMQISNSPGTEGLGWHGMGGSAFGGHFDCPGDVRKAQRPAILKLAQQIRGGGNPTPVPAVRTWTTAGQLTLAALCKNELKELPSAVLCVTLQNSTPAGAFGPFLASYLNAVFTADTQLVPAGTTWAYPGGEWTAQGQLSLAALCQQHLEALPAQVLAMTATRSPDGQFLPNVASYVNSVIGRSTLKPPSGCVLHY